MKTKVLLTLAAVILVIISTVAIGSNMGFKISIPLYQTMTGHTGLNWVSLPFYNSYTDAASARTDIMAISGITGCELDQYQESTGTYLAYDPDNFLEDNFTICSSGQLADANALLVKIGGANGNWVVVGSHSPSMTVPLHATGTGHTGLNWRAVPYHTTAADAAALWTELNTPAIGVELDQYQEATGTYLAYDPDNFLEDNFTITAGGAILIKVGSGKTWTPAHY